MKMYIQRSAGRAGTLAAGWVRMAFAGPMILASNSPTEVLLALKVLALGRTADAGIRK